MTLFYRITRSVLKGYMCLFYGHRVYGIEHLKPGAAILAPNHTSFLDPPIVGVSAPEELAYLARETLYDNALLGFLIRHLNTYPVGSSEQDLASMKLITHLLQDNKKVVIFPEGVRSDDGNLGPLKAGIAMLAMRTRCCIVPVYIDGAFEVWRSTRKFPKLYGKTACVFGSSIECVGYETMSKKEAHEVITMRVADAIANLRQWYLSGAQGSPP